MKVKEMTKEEITKAVELMKPIYDIEKPMQELMCGHYSLCSYAYNVSMELTKYKRAFEILKDLIIFDKKNQAVANGTSIIDLNKEEAELLEELMTNENSI